MKNVAVKVYLRIRNLFERTTLPDNIDAILEEIKNMEDYPDFKVYISYFYPDRRGTGIFINARTKRIGISKLMLYHYIRFYYSEFACDYKNALCIMKGHEVTHMEDYPLPPLRFGKYLVDRKMLCQVNEVHADFGGAAKMANSSRQSLIAACEHEKMLNDKGRFSRDHGDFMHPSWSRRIEYARKYNSDETLIRRIAADTNCHNEELIQKCIEYFDEPVLK